MKSEIRCERELCRNSIAKYGEGYHRVIVVAPKDTPKFMPNAVALCEACGGYSNGSEWKYQCQVCDKAVQPGELVGLFVPHRCHECDAKSVAQEKAAGQVCSRCRQVMSYCCC